MTAAKWRVLVADDEPAARLGVRKLLQRFPEFRVVGECRDGREVLAALDSLRPDVLFLDILMPEMDGLEVIRRRTPERMPVTVFLTAFDKFAIRAFDAEAQDYLVKPVSEVRFASTMKRVRRRLTLGSSIDEPAVLLATSRGRLVVPLREIERIDAADYYARLWVGQRSYMLRESLTALERRLASHGFVRAHRQAIVHVSEVREVRLRADGVMIALLASGATVTISRRRRAAFIAAIKRRGDDRKP